MRAVVIGVIVFAVLFVAFVIWALNEREQVKNECAEAGGYYLMGRSDSVCLDPDVIIEP